jgi:hypothetical protein
LWKADSFKSEDAATLSITSLKFVPAIRPVMPADIKREQNDACPSRWSTGIGEDGLKRLSRRPSIPKAAEHPFKSGGSAAPRRSALKFLVGWNISNATNETR